MSDAMDIRVHRDDDVLRVWRYRGDSARLVVSLSGVGKDDGQTHDFPACASANGRDHVLFIADPKRSWLNAPGVIEETIAEIEAYAQECGAEQICLLGHSMGGFSAMVLPGFTRVDRVFAFAPQYSVHPDVAGDDDRWMNYRDQIAEFRIKRTSDHMNETTDYVLVHGGHKRDQLQRDRFPVTENMRHFIVPGLGHGVPVFLKKNGLMIPAVQAAFDGRPRLLRRTLARVGARHRAVGPAILPDACDLPEPALVAQT